MFRNTVLLAAALAATSAAPAAAADRNGRFAIDGAGAAPCAFLLEASARRDPRLYAFAGWIDGFTSAMNIYERGTFDVTPWQTSDLLVTAVAERCRTNQRQNVHQATVQVIAALMATRLRERSELVVAGESAARGVVIYERTLRDVQSRLGLKPSGRFDDRTRRALQDFQTRNRLKVTGLPDQPTLYLLLLTPRKG